jgi:hypothetical protein
MGAKHHHDPDHITEEAINMIDRLDPKASEHTVRVVVHLAVPAEYSYAATRLRVEELLNRAIGKRLWGVLSMATSIGPPLDDEQLPDDWRHVLEKATRVRVAMDLHIVPAQRRHRDAA